MPTSLDIQAVRQFVVNAARSAVELRALPPEVTLRARAKVYCYWWACFRAELMVTANKDGADPSKNPKALYLFRTVQDRLTPEWIARRLSDSGALGERIAQEVIAIGIDTVCAEVEAALATQKAEGKGEDVVWLFNQLGQP